MNPMSDKDIAEFIKLFQNAQAPKEEAQAKPEDSPYMPTDAADAAKQLGEYLRKLHADDMQSHVNNNTWLQSIDKNVKGLEWTIYTAAFCSTMLALLIGAAVVLLVVKIRIGG